MHVQCMYVNYAHVKGNIQQMQNYKICNKICYCNSFMHNINEATQITIAINN